MKRTALQHNQSLTQGMSSSMMMVPQMQKNLSLLMASIQQLQHEIFLEIENNPALDIKEEQNRESIDLIRTNKNKGEDSKKHFELIEELLTMPETLSDHLIWQLRMENITERYFDIGQTIIENLDENGFFIENPVDLCRQLLRTSPEEVADVLTIIQELDPIGCATANVTESLRVQLSFLEIDEIHKNQLEKCITSIEEELASSVTNFNHIEKTLQHYFSDEEFQEYLHLLVPYPGRSFAYNHIDREVYVIPDAIVSIVGDELEVKINQDIVPILTLNQSILKMRTIKDKEANKLASEWIASAESFMKGLEYRESSLKKVVAYIVCYQKDYFLGIQNYLRPLTRKELAQALDLNESTISRIIANKYIQTTRGVFGLKYFFSQRIGSQDTSGQQILTEILILIEELKARNEKTSDRIISEMLAKKGIKIARRTVSKYKKLLEGNS